MNFHLGWKLIKLNDVYICKVRDVIITEHDSRSGRWEWIVRGRVSKVDSDNSSRACFFHVRLNDQCTMIFPRVVASINEPEGTVCNLPDTSTRTDERNDIFFERLFPRRQVITRCRKLPRTLNLTRRERERGGGGGGGGSGAGDQLLCW